MSTAKVLAFLVAGSVFVTSYAAHSQPRNQVLGTWRMISAQLDPDGRNVPAYGAKPASLLVFTADMHFVEVLTDADVPRFASNARGEGTDAENRAFFFFFMGFFVIYTVDADGTFSGNRVDGATFPNWIGSVRTRKELQLVVEDDHMTENFQRPDGTRIKIIWQRVR